MLYKNFLINVEKYIKDLRKSKKLNLSQYYIYDYKLGWKINKNSKHNSLPYSSNQFGNRKITTKNNNKNKNIILIGDSMVHGDEVSDEHTWASILAKKINYKYNLINLGVSGYGSDQAFLRFKSFKIG